MRGLDLDPFPPLEFLLNHTQLTMRYDHRQTSVRSFGVLRLLRGAFPHTLRITTVGDWKFIIALSLALLTIPITRAQTSPAVDADALKSSSITGTLVPASKATLPISGVTVTIEETGDHSPVGREGQYSFTGVKPGTYTLEASGEGFSRLRITDVVVEPNHSLTLGAETMPVIIKDGSLQVMEEVVVTAKKDLETMNKYVVNDVKPEPFSDRNVDLPRGIDDVQPYYIFDSQAINRSGAADAEDFLKQFLTMDTAATSNNQIYGNQNGNTSSFNLLGLGTNQTLILIDGRRSANANFGPFAMGQPDINGIPLAAIDRIEVLPSSASAIYGGSAVGGVINIILKKYYQGGEIQYSYDTPFNADAPIRKVAATYGFTADHGKTHVMIDAQYSDGKPLVEGERLDLVDRGIETILKNFPALFLFNGYYSTTTNIVGGNPYGNPTNLVLKNGTALNSTFTYIPVGTSPNASTATLDSGFVMDAGTYNFNLPPGTGEYGLQNPLGALPLIKSFGASIRQELSSKLEAFAEFSTQSDTSIAQYNPFAGKYDVQATAPTNPFQGEVNVTFPSGLSVPETTNSVTQSLTVGLLMQLPCSWKSELDYTWSDIQTSFHQYQADPAFGNDIADGTINPFVDTIANPLNLSPYLAAATQSQGETENDLAFRASGPVASFAWGQPTLTFGLEHRKEGSDTGNFYASYPISTDYSYQTINLGQSQSINSVYTEAEIPMVTEKNAIVGLRSLELQAAVRSEDYSVGTGTSQENISNGAISYYGTTTANGQPYHSEAKFTATKPMAGLSYKPVEDIILRASYATAFLPPTYYQLTNNPVPQQSYGATVIDPKTGQVTSGYEYVQNQNSNLTPQNSKDWDIGAVWEPKGQLLRGFRFDFEFFQIKEFNVITSPPNDQFIVDNYPSRVTRDPTTGVITLIDNSSINLFELETEGFDISFGYRKATAIGNFDLYALGTIQEHYKQQQSQTGPLLEYIGYVADGGPAKTKVNATLTWQFKRWTLGWTTLFFDGYKQIGAPGDPVFSYPVYTTVQGSTTIPSQVYHDILIGYSFKNVEESHGNFFRSLASNWTIQVGVKNVFNTLPPLDVHAIPPYYYSPYGDPRLRDLWVSIKHDF